MADSTFNDCKEFWSKDKTLAFKDDKIMANLKNSVNESNVSLNGNEQAPVRESTHTSKNQCKAKHDDLLCVFKVFIFNFSG